MKLKILTAGHILDRVFLDLIFEIEKIMVVETIILTCNKEGTEYTLNRNTHLKCGMKKEN